MIFSSERMMIMSEETKICLAYLVCGFWVVSFLMGVSMGAASHREILREDARTQTIVVEMED